MTIKNNNNYNNNNNSANTTTRYTTNSMVVFIGRCLHCEQFFLSIFYHARACFLWE